MESGPQNRNQDDLRNQDDNEEGPIQSAYRPDDPPDRTQHGLDQLIQEVPGRMRNQLKIAYGNMISQM